MSNVEIMECIKSINPYVDICNGSCIERVDITDRLIMAFKAGYDKCYWTERKSSIHNSGDPYKELGAR